ncbi:3' phosphatase and 5' polynucleotide kinase [Pectobacterium phage POP12]|nr:3' phosphatase and 5' polynucleotide kinase [Pectobacterium phage POP12]
MILTITVGVAGSGKTTYAHKRAKEQGNTIIVSRDDIRFSMFGDGYNYKFTKEKEEIISRMEVNIVNASLSAGKNVIVHDTNLKDNDITSWQEIAKSHDAVFDVQYIDVHITELLKRNFVRGHKAIPIRTIWDMYTKFQKMMGWVPASSVIDHTLAKCVIFDVDGTLTKIGERSPYDFAKVISDPANLPVQELFRMYQENYIVIVVSGRDDSCMEDTIKNLNATGIYPDAIFMRKAGDTRTDIEIKEEILFDIIIKKWNPILAIDDRDTPVGMWRMNGIPCFQVDYGDF